MTIPAWAKGTLVLAAVFFAGAATGVRYERGRTPPHSAAGVASYHLHHLDGELGLDSAQKEAVSRIFARHQGAVDSTWHAVQPRVRATLDSTLREVAAVLTPAQLERYRKMTEARHPGVVR